MKLFTQKPVNFLTPSTRDYCIVPVVPGAKYRVGFGDTDYFIAFTKTAKRLFFSSEYFGGIVIEKTKHKSPEPPRRFFTNGSIIIISNSKTESEVHSLDNSDLITQSDLANETTLRNHLAKYYNALLAVNTDRWEKDFNALLRMDVDFAFSDNNIDFT